MFALLLWRNQIIFVHYIIDWCKFFEITETKAKCSYGSQDGRLMPNDQLLNINGVSLLNMSNSDAMETLRKAMCHDGPTPGILTLVIARRRPGSGEEFRFGSEGQLLGCVTVDFDCS